MSRPQRDLNRDSLAERVEFEPASDQALIHMKLSARRLIYGRKPPRRLRRLDEGTCEIFFFPGLSDPDRTVLLSHSIAVCV
jgi:hypothetical protein